MRINRQYSRGFLIAASAYRRNAKGFNGDFTAQALREQYEHETFGGAVSDRNGFAFGKRSLGVTIAAMREDYVTGLFTKNELITGSCYAVRKAIKNWTPQTFFTYEKHP